MSKFKFSAISISLMVSVSPASIPVVQAQDAGLDSGGQLQEIVVSARKRDEKLRDVPISITAFTAETMQERGITSVYDLARQTPNLSFNQTYGRAFDRPVIRGMSQILGERTVSFVVDGIYIAGNLTGADLDDIESVEVLKGPQAANFGRASLAGVISYRTKRPTAEWQGKVSASMGQHGFQELAGNFSGALVGDKLTFKLGARYYDYEGRYRAISSDGRTPRMGAENTQRLSGALRWQPTENLDLNLRLFAAQNRDGLYTNIISKTLNCFTNAAVSPGNRGGSFCGELPKIPVQGGINIDLADVERQGDPGTAQDTNLYSFEGDWRLGPVTLTGLVSWNDSDEDWITDDYLINARVNGNSGPTQTPSPTMTIANPGNITRLIIIREYQSRELRLASNGSDSRMQWMVGLYDYEQETSGLNGGPRYNVPNTLGVLPRPTLPRGTLYEISQTVLPIALKNRAFFGSFSYNPTERLYLTFEGRSARDEFLTINNQSISNCSAFIEAEFSSFTPRVSVRFLANDDINVYGSVARGNKPGDFNTALCNAQVSAAEFARLSTIAPLGVKEEKSLNYELGTKMRLMDGQMSIDAAIFFTDWDEQQVTQSQTYRTVTGAPTNISLTGNAGKTEVKGFEFNWQFQATRFFDLNLAYGHTDAKFKALCDATLAVLLGPVASPETTSGPCPSVRASATIVTRFADASGYRTANAPEHTATAGIGFRAPGWGGATFFARADLMYQSERFAEIYNHASTGDSKRLDIRFGFERDNWRLTAWARNLTDDRTPDAVVRFFDTDSPAFTRAYQVHFPNGRQVGMTANLSF